MAGQVQAGVGVDGIRLDIRADHGEQRHHRYARGAPPAPVQAGNAALTMPISWQRIRAGHPCPSSPWRPYAVLRWSISLLRAKQPGNHPGDDARLPGAGKASIISSATSGAADDVRRTGCLPPTPQLTQNRTQGRTRALSAAGGTLAAVAVWIIEVPLIGVDLSVRFGSGHPQTIGIGQVIGVSLVASLLAWLLLALLDQRTPRARAAWTSAALVALIVSLALPLSAATTTAAAIGLIAMHLAVAAVVIPSMGRSVRTR